MNLFEAILLRPLKVLTDPSERVFFGYLASALLMGIIALGLSGKSFRETLHRFLDPRVWQHPSAHLDYKLFFVNGALKAVLFSGATLSSVGISITLLQCLHWMFPDFTPFSFDYGYVVVAFTGMSFLVMDFSRFFQHYCFHKVSWLWPFHRVHHSANVLTPMTLFRTHPVESLFSFVRRAVTMGIVSGVCIFLTGSILTGVDIVGVNVIDFVFNVLGSNLRHSHVWLSFGFLNRYVVSPAQHQIHHSRAEKHFDKNFGVALSVWDRLFGTFFDVGSQKPFLIFGVRGVQHHRLRDLIPHVPKTRMPAPAEALSYLNERS